jgi:hypothetical protein
MESTANLLTAGCFLVGQAVAAVATIIVTPEETETSEVGFGQEAPGGRQTRISGRRKGKRPRPQIWRSIAEIHELLGPHYFRCAYQMTYTSFCTLHELLRDRIAEAIAAKRGLCTTTNPNYQFRRPPVPNGERIPASTRLGCALRYFAGGSRYDLMVKFGISHTEVLDSVWFVVGAINKHERFFIEYPANHNKQKQIADAFCNASDVDFSSCAGAIDGILIWISKPSEEDAANCGLGRKFFLWTKKQVWTQLPSCVRLLW